MSSKQTPSSSIKRTLAQAQSEDKEDSDVLREEEYLEKMSKIIKRDFFPSLVKIEKMRNPELASEEENDESLKMSLNQFVDQVKSEDNEIFRQMVEKEDRKWREKLWWMFMAEKKEQDIQLALENEKTYDELKKIDYTRNASRLAICPFEGQNPVFFPKDGVKEQFKQPEKKVKKINYENTRLEEQNTLMKMQLKQTTKETLSRINEMTETPVLLGLKKQMDSKNYDLDSLRNTPRKKKQQQAVNGYNMITMPSPNPNKIGSPIMTWGEVEDTPLRLDQNDDLKGRHFAFQKEDKRTDLAIQLADQIQSKRKALKKTQKNQQMETLVKSVTPSHLKSGFSSSRSSQTSKLLKDVIKIRGGGGSILSTPRSNLGSVKSSSFSRKF